MKRYLTLAAGVLLLALTACTDAPDAVVEATGDATASAADELVVTCTKTETKISSPTVRATSAGVRLTVVDDSGADLQVRTEHEEGLRGVYAEEGTTTVELPPGKSFVLCSDRDGPEHMVAPSDSAEAVTVVVEADESVWKSPVMDCQPVSSMTADFSAPNDPNAAPADISEAEAVVREQVDWVEASDVVERSGYQEGATSVTFRVRREGHTIGEVHLSSMDSKWVVSGYGHCMEATSGGDDAVWFIPPGVEPDPAAQSFEVDVMRVGCAGGRTGAVMEPTIEVSDDRITVTFTVEPVFGGRCPGNDRVRYTVVVGEPIGDREIYDGGCNPGMHGAMSTGCIEEDPVRWRGSGQGCAAALSPSAMALIRSRLVRTFQSRSRSLFAVAPGSFHSRRNHRGTYLTS